MSNESGPPTQWDIAFREGWDAAIRQKAERGQLVGGGALTQNTQGSWVPAIPEPLYSRRKVCKCGSKFWTKNGYRGHYALQHILKLDL